MNPNPTERERAAALLAQLNATTEITSSDFAQTIHPRRQLIEDALSLTKRTVLEEIKEKYDLVEKKPKS